VTLCADICVLKREILQLLLSGGSVGGNKVLVYFMDSWNIIDWFSAIFFFAGFYVHHAPSYSDSATWIGSYLNEAVFATSETSPFEWSVHTGEILYSLSILFMHLKLLRSFALFERLNTLVKILIQMIIDVSQWIVVYALFLFAFSIVMAGAGRPDSILNKCHVKLGNALTSMRMCGQTRS